MPSSTTGSSPRGHRSSISSSRSPAAHGHRSRQVSRPSCGSCRRSRPTRSRRLARYVGDASGSLRQRDRRRVAPRADGCRLKRRRPRLPGRTKGTPAHRTRAGPRSRRVSLDKIRRNPPRPQVRPQDCAISAIGGGERPEATPARYGSVRTSTPDGAHELRAYNARRWHQAVRPPVRVRWYAGGRRNRCECQSGARPLPHRSMIDSDRRIRSSLAKHRSRCSTVTERYRRCHPPGIAASVDRTVFREQDRRARAWRIGIDWRNCNSSASPVWQCRSFIAAAKRPRCTVASRADRRTFRPFGYYFPLGVHMNFQRKKVATALAYLLGAGGTVSAIRARTPRRRTSASR